MDRKVKRKNQSANRSLVSTYTERQRGGEFNKVLTTNNVQYKRLNCKLRTRKKRQGQSVWQELKSKLPMQMPRRHFICGHFWVSQGHLIVGHDYCEDSLEARQQQRGVKITPVTMKKENLIILS